MTTRTDLKGVNVLLVEDRPDHLETFAMYLRRLGATLREARSAQEALDAYDALVPDVIVSDLMMPGVDGLGLIRRLRLKGVNLPAIAVSAHHSAEARSASKLAGFDLHLAKPITPTELFDAICQVLP